MTKSAHASSPLFELAGIWRPLPLPMAVSLGTWSVVGPGRNANDDVTLQGQDHRGALTRELAWRVRLPAAPQTADMQLTVQETKLAQASGHVDRVRQQLLEWLLLTRPILGDGVIDIAELLSLRSGDIDWAQLGARAESALRGIAALVRLRSRVETQVQGLPVAVSEIATAGDLDTYWLASMPTAASAHRRAVKLALATRATWMRLMTLTIDLCAEAVRVIGYPMPPISLLPAVWHFVESALLELETLGRAAERG